MPRNLTSNQKAEIVKAELKTRLLTTIYVNNPDEDVIRILENDTLAALSVGGEDYIGAMLKRGEIQTHMDNTVESVNITISNVGQEISSIIANEGDVLTNSRCVIEEVIFNGDPEIFAPEKAYTLNSYLRPAVWNGYIYKVTTAGITDEAEPTYPIIVGNTVTSGTAVLTCQSPFIDDPIHLFEGQLNKINLTAQVFSFDVERKLGGYSTVSPNTTYDVNCQLVYKDARCQATASETTCDKTLTSCQARSNSTRFGGYPSIPKESVIR